MNKEQAELYVKSVNESKVDPQSYFLAMNIVCFAIAVAFHHTLIFCIVVGFIALVSVLVMVLSSEKPSYFKTTFLFAIQLLITCLALNCIMYAIYQFAAKFVLWEYLASIGAQIIITLLSLIFFKIHAEKFKGRSVKAKITEGVCGSIAGATGAATMLLCRIFAPSFAEMVAYIAIFLNILSCLFGFCVSGILFRAYLIKKYNISKNTNVDKQPPQNKQ